MLGMLGRLTRQCDPFKISNSKSHVSYPNQLQLNGVGAGAGAA